MKYAKLTLETVGANDYPALRTEMVEDLVQIELDAEMESLLEHYEQLVEEMYTNMDDDDLQAHHDKHIEYLKEFPSGGKSEWIRQAHHDKHIEYLKEFPSGDYKTEEEYKNEN